MLNRQNLEEPGLPQFDPRECLPASHLWLLYLHAPECASPEPYGANVTKYGQVIKKFRIVLEQGSASFFFRKGLNSQYFWICDSI